MDTINILDYKRKIHVNDIDMAYYRLGKGEPVIVLHGNSQSSSVMKKVITRLSNSFEVYAIDSRGHGETENSGKEYTFDDMSKDVIQFINDLNLDKVNIVGYSDGANIAYRVAIKSSEKINKMVLISPNYNVNGIAKYFFLEVKIVSGILKVFSFMKCARDARYRLILMIRDESTDVEELKKINCDTLFLYAGIELVLKNHVESFKKSIKNSKLKRVKHSTHLDIIFRRKAIDIIEEFLLNKKTTIN